MNVQEQEKLFRKLRKEYAGWSSEFISGYVHGAQDESMFDRPHMDQTGDSYSTGYVVGFAVHRGIDATVEPWFAQVPVQYRGLVK